ncbi:MAG TPA: M20/M25/M40 family metallo-hydrolase [Terracidiphilus sp.]|jgi:acetylornithine deacetylase/succinyl-diaminopimelate desuccinylase-like protein
MLLPFEVGMPLSSSLSAYARVTALASRRPIHAAFAWLHANTKSILDWQVELCTIPAPPFGEQARSEWLRARFDEIGLDKVQIDEVGNVLGFLPSPHLSPESTGHIVVLSAHLDTVFPADTPLHPQVRATDGHERIEAPGACDNGAGVVGMMAIAQALVKSGVELPAALLFLGNVGEEGEGDLRGVRHLYKHARLAGRIAAHVVLDGAGADAAVTQALGSRRYQITISGPGGHSFTEAGTPNPIVAMSSALAALASTAVPEEPRTTLNVGTIHGGTSVNSIPEVAAATVDFRSTTTDELVRLEVALHRAVEDAVDMWNNRATALGRMRGILTYRIEMIGDRPAARLPENSPILEALRGVDRHLGLQSGSRLGSTDANIPLSLGVPSLSVGAGGEGGGAHTLAEWYSTRNRELGLRRILLLTAAMLDWAAEQ